MLADARSSCRCEIGGALTEAMAKMTEEIEVRVVLVAVLGYMEKECWSEAERFN